MAKEVLKRDPAEVMKDLPEVCYARNPADNTPVILKRGVIGYWPARHGVIPEVENERMGVNVAQEEAMMCGSIAGFHVPGADPLNYTDPTMYAKLEATRAQKMHRGAA